MSAAALLIVAPLSLSRDEGGALAQDSKLSREEAARQLAARQETLKSADTKATDIAGEVASIEVQRQELNQRLIETADLVKRSEARMTQIEERQGELEAQQKLVQGDLDIRRGQLVKLLSAMQRMGRNPPPVIITRRSDALEMVRSAMLLARAFPELKTQADDLAGRLSDLDRVKTSIRTEGDKLRSETQRLADAKGRVASLIETKKRTLVERQQELVAVKKYTAEISRSVTDLNQLIAELDSAVMSRTTGAAAAEAPPVASDPRPAQVASAIPPPLPPSVTAAQATDAATAAAQALASQATQTQTAAVATPMPLPPKPAPPIKLALATPPPTKPSVLALEPQAGGHFGNSGRFKPEIPFQLAKARLPLPAQGRRVISYGERRRSTSEPSQGLYIETRFGAQVTSPCDGWVVFAGPFRSYGQLLIINASDTSASDRYHVVLGGLSQIDVQIGQFVLAAEPVGTMGQPPAKAQAQPPAPVLYVEFRRNDRPIDPEPWWASSTEKVQG